MTFFAKYIPKVDARVTQLGLTDFKPQAYPVTFWDVFGKKGHRRGQHTDFVRPGKHYEGYTLHIVLDTSGSMTEELSKILGVIGAFCEATSIETIHILQCDTTVTVDEWVYATDLENYAIHGYGGSDMSPAMLQLAEDSEVERIIVITDGDINFPQNPPPYQVLWVLTPQNDSFRPNYGQIVFVDSSE